MKGKTVPCTACKKILFRYFNAKGEVSFDMLCPNPKCQEMVSVKVQLQPVIVVEKVVKFLAVVTIILFVAGFIFLSAKNYLLIKSQTLAQIEQE